MLVDVIYPRACYYNRNMDDQVKQHSGNNVDLRHTKKLYSFTRTSFAHVADLINSC